MKLKEIDYKKLKKKVDTKGYFIVRSFLTKNEVDKIMSLLKKEFSPRKDKRISGKYLSDMNDFQRLDVGEYPASSRFARYFFKFPWNKNDLFSKIASEVYDIRSHLANYKIGLWKELKNNSLLKKKRKKNKICYSYLIQYPVGGGFMSCHREYYSKNKKGNTYVVYLLLTTKGKDFKKGGAYIIKNKKLIMIEDEAKAGDVIIYKGNNYHGVKSIDNDKNLNLNKISGRVIFTPVMN